MKKGITICLILLVAAISARSQDIEDFIDRYSGGDAEAYIQPLASASGSDLNSGWFRSARIDRMGFRLYIGLVVQTAPIADKHNTFTATTPDYFSPSRTVEASTVVGPPMSTVVQGDNGTAYSFPGGAGVSSLPLAVPQVTIGNVFGTDASFRFFAIDFGGDVGKVDVFGWGIRHSISQYLNDFPVHLAVGYYRNSFKIGDDVDVSTSLISLQASYRMGVLEFYGGPGYETADLDFTYTPSESDEETTIKTSGDNTIRFTFGAAVNLGAFVMNADVNLASQSSFSAGIGVQIGNKIKKSDETN